MGVDFKFDANLPDFTTKLKAALPEIRLFIAANMQTNRGMLFAKSGKYNGHEGWAKPKFRDGQPLKARGTLAQSIGPRVTNPQRPVRNKGGIVRIAGDVVQIGSSLIYAAMMNWGTTGLPGGVLKPKNKQALAFPLPRGKKATGAAKSALTGSKGGMMIVKSVKIPARRFDTWTTQDEEEINIALRGKIYQVLMR